MTVPAGDRIAGPFHGNDVTEDFPFTFFVFDAADIRVILTSASGAVDAVVGSTCLIAINPDQEATPGGTVTFASGGIAAPLPTGTSLTVLGDLEYEQPVAIPDGGAFFASVVEKAIDRCVVLMQQLREIVGRGVTVPAGAGLDAQIAAPVIGDALLATNSAGTELVFKAATDLDITLVTPFIETLIDDATAAEARATLGVSDTTKDPQLYQNLELNFSVAANALTATLSGQGGAALSASNKGYIAQRSATLTSGTYALREISANISATVSAGSTLGHDTGAARIYWYLIDNAGTQELAFSSYFHGFSGRIDTTAEGGAGGADSPLTMYSTTARSGVAFRCIGRTIDSNSAGTWAAVPSTVQPIPFDPYEGIDGLAAPNNTPPNYRLPAINKSAVVTGNNFVQLNPRDLTQWTPLAAGALTGATVDIVLTQYQALGFSNFKVRLVNARPASDNNSLRLRTSTDGGSTFAAAGTDYGHGTDAVAAGAGSAVAPFENNADSFMQITVNHGNASNEGFTGEIETGNLGETSYWKPFFWRGVYVDNTATPEIVRCDGSGMRKNTADIDALRLYYGTGNHSDGTYQLLGRA